MRCTVTQFLWTSVLHYSNVAGSSQTLSSTHLRLGSGFEDPWRKDFVESTIHGSNLDPVERR